MPIDEMIEAGVNMVKDTVLHLFSTFLWKRLKDGLLFAILIYEIYILSLLIEWIQTA